MRGIMSEQVRINEDAIKADLKKMGVTAGQVCESMGVNRNFITNAFARKIVGVETVRQIERALFREEGAYVIRTEATQSTPKSGDTSAVLKHLDTHLFEIEKQIKAATDHKELMDKLTDLETAIKSTNTWLARLYAVWTNEKSEKGAK